MTDEHWITIFDVVVWEKSKAPLLAQYARNGAPVEPQRDTAASSGFKIVWKGWAGAALRQQDRESILAARILMVLSTSILFTLGIVHLVYTFWGPMLTPRDPALQVSMSQISPVISKETTMWRAWVGFNVSHSMGLILFGLVFGFLALAHSQLLFRSPFLLIVGLAMLGGFVVLCRVYFFSSPLTGISIALACYVASIVLSRVGNTLLR